MKHVQWRLDHALFNTQFNTRLIKHLSNFEPQLLNDRCAWFCTGIFFISLSTKSTVKLLNITKVKISIVKMRFVKYFSLHQKLMNINFKILLHSVKEKINYIYFRILCWFEIRTLREKVITPVFIKLTLKIHISVYKHIYYFHVNINRISFHFLLKSSVNN